MGCMCVLTSQLLVHGEGERQRVFTQVGKALPALAELGSDSGSSQAGTPLASSANMGQISLRGAPLPHSPAPAQPHTDDAF